jgi:hypothetical protein
MDSFSEQDGIAAIEGLGSCVGLVDTSMSATHGDVI